MIQANELRMGNWVYDLRSTKVKVSALTKSLCGFLDDDGCAGYECMHPIPLTPEILEKCGFEFDTVTFSKIYFLLAEGDNGYDIWIGGLSKVKLNPIKYLHQLQNLYFALTGEELTVNL